MPKSWPEWVQKERHKSFVRTAREAAKEVKRWPKWKREALVVVREYGNES